MASENTVSGKKVLFAILGVAILLWFVLYLVTNSRLRKVQEEAAREGVTASQFLDGESLLSTWNNLPSEWIQISLIEGQGYAIYIPCDGQKRMMQLTTEEGRALFTCPACDTLSTSVIRAHQPSVDSLIAITGAPAETLKVLPVNAALLQKFHEAPFQDRLMIWIRQGGSDSLLFTPSEYEMEFEVLRAEDESPEGCSETGLFP